MIYIGILRVWKIQKKSLIRNGAFDVYGFK